MRVMMRDCIKLAGVQANNIKYDSKILSNMTELLQTNRIKAIGLMCKALLDSYNVVLNLMKINKNIHNHQKMYLKIFLISSFDQH